MEVIKKTIAKRVNKYYSSQPEDAIIRKNRIFKNMEISRRGIRLQCEVLATCIV